MNTSRKGDETEAVILGRLMQRGLSVSVPFGDNDRYDLVVDDDGRLFRVQCKTGNWVNGAVRFNLYTSTVDSERRSASEYTHEEIDVIAVYSAHTDDTYWVPIEETGRGEMRFRVDDSQPRAPKTRINWADDYVLSAAFDRRPE